jgi:hypothetical protein
MNKNLRLVEKILKNDYVTLLKIHFGFIICGLKYFFIFTVYIFCSQSQKFKRVIKDLHKMTKAATSEDLSDINNLLWSPPEDKNETVIFNQ